MATLSILSYNIHKGFSAGNLKLVLSKIRTAIRQTQADLVFLQEVHGEHAKHEDRIKGWPRESQFEYLADSIWPHYAYGKNAVYSHGHHGNAILSKYRIVSAENVDITTSRFARRGILHAIVQLPKHDKPLHALCTHLDLTDRGRKKQGLKLIDWIAKRIPETDPMILAGDFNDWNERTSRTLEKSLDLQEAFRATKGSYAKTFPARVPALKLDRVYFRGLKALQSECLRGQPWRSLSDHLALLTHLEL